MPPPDGVERAPVPPRVSRNAEHPTAVGTINEFVKSGCCKYIHGHPGEGEWRMCGHNTRSPTHPWCDFHQQRVVA